MKSLFLILPLFLMACTVPDSPAQSVFLAKSDYVIGLKTELTYSKYPRCAAGAHFTIKTPCSEVSVIRKMQKADDAALVALDEAELAVRTPGYGQGKVTTALASAKALVVAFKGITDLYANK